MIKGGSNDGQASSFTYDEAGNTKKRTIGARTQDLTWDTEGHLATLTEAGKTTSYLYDADGNRLIAKNGDGSSTLTLPGGNELHVAAGGTKTGTRYYTHNGETVGVRQGTNISYLLTDDQGTAMTAMRPPPWPSPAASNLPSVDSAPNNPPPSAPAASSAAPTTPRD
ncbi:hypothetical protein ACSHXN_45490 (plasmid) [Streptomyces sp. HUAS TT11]|uniref:hypothetical protein n=1 Tax=Streptomyces sp. HUAS TT11 TaxID=3447508 RepID=UPI003F65E2E7